MLARGGHAAFTAMESHHFYEWTTALLNTSGGTIRFRVGFCTTIFHIITCNPLNLECILDKSKSLPCFGEVEEDAIALTLSRSSFNINLKQKLVKRKIFSALEEAYKKNAALDLQDLLLSFGLDYACLIALGKEDMGSLVPEFSKALEETMEARAYSLIRPTKFYCHKYNESLQDLFISIVVGCRDMCASALCWFFWLVSKHPHVEDKIMLQLSQIFNPDKCYFVGDELNGMQYLEAALCETMRLYPPFPLGHMRAMEDKVLPDGTCVEKGSGILYLIYAANRMQSVCGEDALRFKPERWIKSGICVRECNYPFFGHMDMI